MSLLSSPTIVGDRTMEIKYKSESIFSKTLEYCATSLKPTVGVLKDVANHYAQRIYYHILSSRNHQKYYKFCMEKATSYEQWAGAGYMLDRCQGKDEWKNDEKSNDYDYELIKDRLFILKTIRRNADIPAMIFNLRTSLSRNLGDMGNPKLYEKTHVGTKLLLEDYIDEVTKQLNFICDVDIEDFTIHEKLEFFRNTQKSFGRTALLLSGGGTFGLYHVGIIKSLCEQKLLPKIISGSSAGAIVAAMFGTRTDKEIHLLSEPENINWNFFERENQKGLRFTKISRLLKQGVVFDIEVFNECMKSNIGDITFAEAYNRTGRILNITVSSSTNFEMPRILNYLTAPNVLIRTAVVASSAVPFLFSSAPLLAKDVYRNIVPWNPSGHQWIDGSVEGDLPMQRISELFGVNHYCVSQVNPHIIPFLNNSHQKSNVLTRAVSSIASIVNAEFQHRLRQIIELGFHNYLIIKGHSILCQKYVGDITIVPHVPWSKYIKLMSSPDEQMAREYCRMGELASWTKFAILKNHGLIEQCLNQNIKSLRERLVIESEPTPIERPLRLSLNSRPTVLFKAESLSLPSLDSNSGNSNFHSSDSSLEESKEDQDNRMKLNRNHRSAGDVRNHLTGFGVFNKTGIQKPFGASTTGADPLFFLDLTFEDSDQDL